ncbi:hypothetical protein CBR_g37800 [Chara braunii]|uniref:Uncharacterized protein n=1 Tax=Chara braunii TaxID=69332 RepID=A0A388LNT9_CHABU|nr:hypothetical protein CBR_g37800 [Chara braunii]|eukprot:GBG83929.1 hypothetical protein CBR_g37800 [Chara braunii]
MRLRTDLEGTLQREKPKEGKGKSKEQHHDANVEVSGDHNLAEEKQHVEEGMTREASDQEMTHETWEPLPGLIATEAELPAGSDQRQEPPVVVPAEEQQGGNIPPSTMAGNVPGSTKGREEGELSHRRAVIVETGEIAGLSNNHEREELAQSQDSSKATGTGTRGRTRKLEGEEAVSSQPSIVMGLRNNAQPRVGK